MGVAGKPKAVVLVTFGFLAQFSAWNAVQGLQTSLNQTLGYVNLGALYFTFAALSPFAPKILEWIEARSSQKWQATVGALMYIAFMVANIVTPGDHFDGSWVLYIALSAVVGIGAPIIWTAQNEIIGRCAFRDGNLSGDVAAKTAEYNGFFFSVYQLSGIIGTLLSAPLLQLFGDSARVPLVLVMCAFALTGCALFLLLPYTERGLSAPVPGVWQTATVMARDVRLAYILVPVFVNGLMLAFIFGDYTGQYVTPTCGPWFVGIALASFYGLNSVATTIYSSMLSSNPRLRLGLFGWACFIQAFVLIALTFLELPHNYVHVDGKWEKLADPGVGHFVLLVAGAVLLALGDAMLESQLPAMIQAFFMGTRDDTAANAQLKLWQSLGFAVMFFVDAAVPGHMDVKCWVLAGLLAASMGFLVLLHTKYAHNGDMTHRLAT